MNTYNKEIYSSGFTRDFSKGKSFDFSEWNPIQTYTNDSFKQDFVKYKGNIYVCIHTNTNVVPGTSDCWMLALERVAGTTFVPIIDSEGNLTWDTYTGGEVPGVFNIKGEPGKQGEPGKDGKDGLPGSSGKSSYELWLESGNTGTVNDFINSLKGEQGAPGEGVKIESVTAKIDSNVGNPTVTVNVTGDTFNKNFEFIFNNLKGEPGKDGSSVSILGALNSIESLKDYSKKSNKGDGYLIGKNLWIYQGSIKPNTTLEIFYDEQNEIYWLNVGEIKGPKGDDAPIPSFKIENGHLFVIIDDVETDLGLVKGKDGISGEPGKDGVPGENGIGIISIESPENFGIAGQTDTYVIKLSNGDSYNINVKNGNDGNHILFGHGVPENVTDLNTSLEYIFNPCGYIEPDDLNKIIANEGDIYIDLDTGEVFEYSTEWEFKGNFQCTNNSDPNNENLVWEDIGF